MKKSACTEGFSEGETIHIERSRTNCGTRLTFVLPLRLILFLVLAIGCGIYDPGQRKWKLEPVLANEDASVDDAERYDAETDEMDAEDGDQADADAGEDADATTLDAQEDSCLVSEEVCDREDNNCDGETDGQEASDNCMLDNADAVCEKGQCVVGSCEEFYEDCDREDENGCETLLTEVENCGECGRECEFENATAICSSGRCEIDECHDLFADCNGDPSDGCETILTLANHCGSCENVCPEPEIGSGSSYICEDKECKLIDCESGLANCDDDPETSCDTDIFNSFENCGSCGRTCNPWSADRCIDGDCSCGEIGGRCLPPYCCDEGFCRLSCQNL